MESSEERKETKNMEHHFNVELAKEYGILEAIILNNLQFWIEKNRANGTNFHDGHYWTYNSAKAFSELFPYASQKQIRKALQNLIGEGIIQTGNYNKNPSPIRFCKAFLICFCDAYGNNSENAFALLYVQ